VDNIEQHNVKREKLLETPENKAEDIQEYISGQFDSLLGELKQRKLEGPPVILSSDLTPKMLNSNNQISPLEIKDSSDVKTSLVEFLVTKDGIPTSSKNCQVPGLSLRWL
jgi:hypothetical protein